MRDLEVLSAYSHSIRSVRNNFQFAFQVSWPWMLFLLPFNIAEHAYLLFNPVADPKKVSFGILAIIFGYSLMSTVAFSSIAVMWHRYILLDEVPSGLARLRLDTVVFRYIGNAILMALAGLAAGIVFGIVYAIVGFILGKFGLLVLIPATIAFGLATISYAFALGIKLPAVAIGRRDCSFSDVLSRSKGNFWQFIGLALLVFLSLIGIALVLGILTYVIASIGSQTLLFVSFVLQLFVNWIVAIWNVTILTSLYGYFVEDRDF
jgi:hypothetical protein